MKTYEIITESERKLLSNTRRTLWLMGKSLGDGIYSDCKSKALKESYDALGKLLLTEEYK